MEIINRRTKTTLWFLNHSCSTSNFMLFPDTTSSPCSEMWKEVPEAPPQNAYWNFSTLDPPEGEERQVRESNRETEPATEATRAKASLTPTL